MTVALKPLGVTCNIQCQYCYQNPLRDSGGNRAAYDIGKMKSAVVRNGGPFALFGGEALLVPATDLEALWSWGLEKYGRNSVQTNGTLIDNEHVRLFKAYKVDVGISVDGPGELNDVRWAGTLKATREATERSHAAIERLCREGIVPGLIVTLHRGNATADKLPAMHAWFQHLEAIGVRAVRLHVLEVESSSVRAKYCLSVEENLAALLSLLELERSGLKELKFDLFRDMRNLLLGEDETSSCVWNACDPYTTKAVQGVEGDGQSSNCDRTNTEGIDFVKANTEGFERYLALHVTAQEHGGCKACRFFLMCKGQCPGTAIRGDWRNRTEYCAVWKRLYEHLESDLRAQGQVPVSLREDREELEQLFVEAWRAGRNTNLSQSVKRLEQRRAENARPATVTDATTVLPEFTRVVWVSDRAREVWQPRLERITKAWADIEWLSVVQGFRRCAITMVDPQALVARANEWARHGIQALPIATQRVDPCSRDGESYVYRTVVGTPRDVSAFRQSLDAGDHDGVAALLGYPRCCSDSVKEVSARQTPIDPTWAIASRSAARTRTDYSLEVGGADQCNVLWRWAGIRAVPHLPCSFDCRDSAAFSDSLIELGRRNGRGEEMDWLAEILSWPVEWSALHGIAEVKTPILKIATRTDTTDMKRIVQRSGKHYPREGAKGLAFPYVQPRTLHFTDSRAFRRGLQHPLAPGGSTSRTASNPL